MRPARIKESQQLIKASMLVEHPARTGGGGMSVFDREKGMVAVIAAERDCFNYRLDDPDRCSVDRCLCLEIARFLPPWPTWCP